MMKNILKDALIHYYGNECSSEAVLFAAGLSSHPQAAKMEMEIAISQKEWDDVPCDSEGATVEQEAQLKTILEKTAKAIMSM